MKRRQFLEMTTIGTAGILVGCGGSEQQATPAAGQPQSPAQARVNLKLTLWGSCLYVFSQGGRKVEVGYLKSGLQVPGCDAMPHEPRLELVAGAAKILADETTVTLGAKGEIPAAAFRISSSSLPSGAPPLEAEGLADAPPGCPSDVTSIRSLAYVPTLTARGSALGAQWRQQTLARFEFEHGTLTARRLLNGEAELAQWEIKSSAGTVVQAVTETLELTVPLAADRVTFESDQGRLTLGIDGLAGTIEARLLANPAPTMSSQTLKKGEKLPHYCALFATFDPVPAAADRAELYFERYCQERLAQATTGGPSPGKYCPGGKVIL